MRCLSARKYPVGLALLAVVVGCASPPGRSQLSDTTAVPKAGPTRQPDAFSLQSSPAPQVSRVAFDLPDRATVTSSEDFAGIARLPTHVLAGSSDTGLALEESQPGRHDAVPADEPLDTLDDQGELSVDQLVAEVLTRNPSLEAASAAWRAAVERYPQAISFDDAVFAAMIGPGGVGMDNGGGWMVQASQEIPWSGKRAAVAAMSLQARPKRSKEASALLACDYPKQPGQRITTITWHGDRPKSVKKPSASWNSPAKSLRTSIR